MITLKIRYRKHIRPTVIKLDVSGKTTVEEIAKQTSIELTKRFKRYAPKISERSLQKYRFAQYMMLKIKLSEVIK
jgi:hypothetical protein